MKPWLYDHLIKYIDHTLTLLGDCLKMINDWRKDDHR